MDIDTINKLLDEEIEFAKRCSMPQFVMGLQQAKKVINEFSKQGTAPEVPVQEQFKEKGSKTINQIRSYYGLEPIECGEVIIVKLIEK